jgi:hypothetical protein
VTPEHKAKLKAGRERAAKEGRIGGKRGPRGPRTAKEEVPLGRFSIDDVGNVTVLDRDLVHGVTLDAASARDLALFLNRCLPPMTDRLRMIVADPVPAVGDIPNIPKFGAKA